MSGCSRYSIGIENRLKVEKYDDLSISVKCVCAEVLKDYEYLYLFGSRFKGRWRFCSDFDLAVPEENPKLLIGKAEEYSERIGLKIELRNSRFFEKNCLEGFRIDREAIS